MVFGNPAFASGLDARRLQTPFSWRVDADCRRGDFADGLLVGWWPAYNDTTAAQVLLESLDVPYLAVQGLEFQSLQDWQASSMGLTPAR